MSGPRLRVLLTLHHRLHPDAGAPGATLALGAALERQGCAVDYFGHGEAFPRWAKRDGEKVAHQLAFPPVAGAHLLRHGRGYDVVDASTGDAWVWAALRRGSGPSLVTRAHGLEHTFDERTRAAAISSGPPLRRRYGLYHGGYRLWEVARSLRASDHCVMLNGADRDYARDRLGLPADRLSVIPNGISDDLAALPEVGAGSGGLLRIAFIGRWTTYKGRHTLVQTATRLRAEGLDFTVTIMGTGEERGVAEHFPPEIRDRITVIPVFANRELPLLLRDMDVFAFPTISEGSSLSLMEAMACGLAPVATAVGAAPDLIAHNDNGLLVAVDDPVGMAAAIAALARDRGRLDAMRRSAQRTAKALSWSHIGARTLALYREVLAARSA